MNRVSMMLACAAMLFAVQPALATDDDVSAELAEIRELMQGLQEKVQAQDEQLVHQGQMLEQAQEVVRIQQSEGTGSGLDDFLDSISVGGHVSGSYNYNFNTPKHEDGGVDLNAGPDGVFLPFHRDHNQFTVDQIWFSLSKEATEESRGGFAFDILYGQNANFFGQGVDSSDSRRVDTSDGTSDYYVHQAYIEYQCDCLGPEVNLKFGKFSTLVGAEVAQAPANFNITRGNVYSWIQPVDHLGVLATTDLGGMAEISAGIVNSGGSSISAPDNNKEKSYILSALVGDDKMNLRTSFIYGAEMMGNNHDRAGLVDVTATFNPTDNVSLWANYDYLYVEDTGLYVNAIAIAGRLAVTDKIGASLRGEYIREHVSSTPEVGDAFGVNDVRNKEYYSMTGTADYALTDHLMARGEIRFDWISDPNNSGVGLTKNSERDADNQTVGLVELVYSF